MPRALIADDEPLLREELRAALQEAWPALSVVAEVGDGHAAVAAALAHRPEVVFLDVSMPHLDGMDAARQLREHGFGGEIVFVTAYERHALEAFEQRAIDFLVKPLDLQRMADTVERLKAHLAAPSPAPALDLPTLQSMLAQALGGRLPRAPAPMWLKATRGASTHLVPVESVVCFRAVQGYTQLLTPDGEHLVDEPLRSLVARLDPACFVQVHRSAVVNLHHVHAIRRDKPGTCVVVLKHGLGEIEASRAGTEALRRV
jgi:DNA-binding LytR/AlgR family response regulator